MAHATKSLSFGVTASTTYENPYALARKFATLDHISQGRVGWNIVTSYLDSAAKSYGLDEQVPHDERYARADEFMQVVYKLLEGSWQEGAVVKDKKTGVYVKPDAVKRIDHKGCVDSRICNPGRLLTVFQKVLPMCWPQSARPVSTTHAVPAPSWSISVGNPNSHYKRTLLNSTQFWTKVRCKPQRGNVPPRLNPGEDAQDR